MQGPLKLRLVTFLFAVCLLPLSSLMHAERPSHRYEGRIVDLQCAKQAKCDVITALDSTITASTPMSYVDDDMRWVLSVDAERFYILENMPDEILNTHAFSQVIVSGKLNRKGNLWVSQLYTQQKTGEAKLVWDEGAED